MTGKEYRLLTGLPARVHGPLLGEVLARKRTIVPGMAGTVETGRWLGGSCWPRVVHAAVCCRRRSVNICRSVGGYGGSGPPLPAFPPDKPAIGREPRFGH
jgi:hypothetical protein